ncbi:hypothetical protein Tco_1232743, partial [Tanacetum coccineum]
VAVVMLKVTRMAVEVAAVVGEDGEAKVGRCGGDDVEWIYGGVWRRVGRVGRRSAGISSKNG